MSSVRESQNPNLRHEGLEIHQILATYINHLVRTRRATYLELFDTLMRGAGAEAGEVLEKFRDNHVFNPEKILATELHIALDENFLPVEHLRDDGRIADYEGTLDLVMLYSLTEADIDDWKSYHQVITVDTLIEVLPTLADVPQSVFGTSEVCS